MGKVKELCCILNIDKCVNGVIKNTDKNKEEKILCENHAFIVSMINIIGGSENVWLFAFSK